MPIYIHRWHVYRIMSDESWPKAVILNTSVFHQYPCRVHSGHDPFSVCMFSLRSTAHSRHLFIKKKFLSVCSSRSTAPSRPLFIDKNLRVRVHLAFNGPQQSSFHQFSMENTDVASPNVFQFVCIRTDLFLDHRLYVLRTKFGRVPI